MASSQRRFHLFSIFPVLVAARPLVEPLLQAGSRECSPFGRRMCDQLCRNTIGCLSYVFKANDLLCHVITPSYPSQLKDKVGYLFNVTEEVAWNTSLKHKCPEGSRIFQNRNKTTTRCSFFDGMINTKPTQRPWDSPDQRTRLLMSRRRAKSQTHLKQLNLNTSAVTYHSVKINCHVREMLYLRLLRRVIIAACYGTDILAITLHDEKLSTLSIGLEVKDMDVDEHRQVIFMNVFKYGIYRMPATGGNVSHVWSLKGHIYAQDIVADAKRRQIYISTDSDVIRASYEGNTIDTVVKGPVKVALMVLETNDDVLYYTYQKRIIGLSLQANSSRTVARLTTSSHDMVLYDSKLYVSTLGHIATIDLKSGDTYVSKLSSSYAVSICLIP